MPRKPGSAYAGIDVAIAKSKRLPIVVARRIEGRLEPLALRDHSVLPPRGPGNEGIVDAHVARRYAIEARDYLRAIERDFGLSIRAIAIDAPSAFCPEGVKLRDCEAALAAAGFSFFTTPTHAQFDAILERARSHLATGGDPTRVPFVNKLWMNAGVALFDVLRRDWPCFETYPYAIVRAMGLEVKKTRGGHAAHLRAALKHTGWKPRDMDRELRSICFGSPHDRVDAYLACWAASLPRDKRRAYGTDADDAIWVPRLQAASSKRRRRE
jgi:predicted nuclease with RNAse H fold